MVAVAATVAAGEALPSCQGPSIADLKSSGLPLLITDLPPTLLLAREAKVFVETANLKLQASQDFLSPKSEVTCLSSEGPQSTFRESLNVPSLLDLTVDKSVGNSVWLFNLLVDGKQVGIWDQVSRLQSKFFQLKDLISTAEHQVLFSQINHEQFELIIKWKDKAESKAIVLIYDAAQP